MKTVELFAGTKSFSKVAKAQGHTTLTFDNDPKLYPDVLMSVMDIEELPGFDILWASPPCTTFSVASISHYWTNGKPKNEKALFGIAMLDKTIKLIKENQPKYWFIENPRGMMRKVIDEIFAKYDIKDYQRHTVSYCQYGSKIMKPTDIWTNCKEWVSRPICKPGAPCHERAGRGSKTGVQGIYSLEWERARGNSATARGNSATARGVIPPSLFEEIFNSLNSEKK
jgi:hypothetical protein